MIRSNGAESMPLLPKYLPSSTSSDAGDTASPPPFPPPCGSHHHRPLAVLSGHAGSVSCLALCGEFVLSASQAKDIIVRQQPDLRQLARFGHGEGSVKAVAAVGSRVFTAHQDSRIRVWKLSRSSENAFRLFATLPTTRDYLGRFLDQRNYVQTRRNHRKLWIEHADSISCLAVHGGLVYSGSWDKTLKVWRISDLKCLESIRAHDDAINALAAASSGTIYSASADGKIKVWERKARGLLSSSKSSHCLKGVLNGRRGVSWNAVVVSDDGRFVHGGGSDGRVMVWEREEGEEEWEWRVASDVRAHEMSVLCLCARGEYVCSGSADRTICVWRRGGCGELVRVGVLRGHEGPVKCLQAAAGGVGGGFLVYSGGLDRSLRVWWVSMAWGDDGGGGDDRKEEASRYTPTSVLSASMPSSRASSPEY